jgi:hypothetical protein
MIQPAEPADFQGIPFPRNAEQVSPYEFAMGRAKQIELDRRLGEVGMAIEKYFGPELQSESLIPAVSAMLGNINVETGNTFDFKQKQKGGNGYGLFQFDFHKPYYRRYLESKGLEDSVDSQVRYVYDNIFGDQQKIMGEGNAEKMREALKATDPLAISDSFQNIFLKPGKPHQDRRREASRMYSILLTPAK